MAQELHIKGFKMMRVLMAIALVANVCAQTTTLFAQTTVNSECEKTEFDTWFQKVTNALGISKPSSEFKEIFSKVFANNSKLVVESAVANERREVKFERETINDEDIKGIRQNGKNRVMDLEAAKNNKDKAVKATVTRYLSTHPGDYWVIELETTSLGTNPATQLQGYKIFVNSPTQIQIEENISVNEKKEMFFADVMVNRPRTLIFIKKEAGISISPAAKIELKQVTEIKK
jgi:hypothetical protein